MKCAAAALLALTGVLLAGCASAGKQAGRQVAVKPIEHASRQAAGRCRAGAVQQLGNSEVAWSGLVPERVRVFRGPGLRAFASFGPRNVNGFATVFGVLARKVDADCDASWYQVELPIPPNGATGWVQAGRLQVAVVHTRIVVDLSRRRLTLLRDGRAVLNTIVAVGSPSTPTPTGRFYVNQRLIPADPTGPWGPAAIGISAHSDVLTHWVQGGPIAIHGTNDPGSIGLAASHGCIRVANDVLRRLFWQTPAGTPVIIAA